MAREGTVAERNFNQAKRIFDDEKSMEEEDELTKTLDAISEKLKLIEDSCIKDENKNLPVNEDEDTVDCKFSDTCYAARFKMGTCPCELKV